MRCVDRGLLRRRTELMGRPFWGGAFTVEETLKMTEFCGNQFILYSSSLWHALFVCPTSVFVSEWF